MARGDIDEPVTAWQFIELRALTKSLRRQRERQGLSLTDISERSGLTGGMISQLENGWNSNPTLSTLYPPAENTRTRARSKSGGLILAVRGAVRG
jgi:transcriptional regulator with XRE-family HTH domain